MVLKKGKFINSKAIQIQLKYTNSFCLKYCYNYGINLLIGDVGFFLNVYILFPLFVLFWGIERVTNVIH